MDFIETHYNTLIGDEDNTLYEVEVVSGNKARDKYIVFRNSLIRREYPVTKVGMYKWIKDNTYRDHTV